MSQRNDTVFQLSGEDQSPASTAYSLQQYLAADGGLTERLLKGLDVGEIVGRAQAVGSDVQELASRIDQPSQKL
ncbi:hypothetical protein C8A00DRAFT_35355 [Chaetomidium leptoderma]|uniref:Uncharacterized protein n=1 Tax=Chaetomidium leptoderma TaxID=669021 RepID=A0AAN6ZU42_9PEZI|nr:hypothetical protein C8A00DRAFT_35355 [Chaetomidium leptoderma]